jgi:Flp pilus assembly protein TadD
MAFARPLALLCAALLIAGCAEEPKRASKPASRAPVAATKPAKGKPAAKKPGATAAKPVVPPPPPVKPLTPSERYDQALQQMKANDLQAAEKNLLVSVTDYPDKTGPHTNLGIVYAKTNRKGLAVAEFTKAVTLSSKNTVAHNWLGVLARERGEYVRAEQWYKQALAADSSNADAQLNLAILYDRYLKRPADALAAYKRYDQLARGKDTRVAIWIAELQAQMPAPAGKVDAPAPAQKPASLGPRS